MSKIERGGAVNAQDMRDILLPEEHERYERDWREQLDLRKDLKEKPEEVREYDRLLKTATFAYSKADAHSGAGRGKTARPMFNKSETAFERLWEYLSEHIAGHGELEMWFDRPVKYTAATHPGSTPGCMPMVITSKSAHNISDGKLPGMLTKREVKLAAIEEAQRALDAQDVDQEMIQQRLKSTQARLKRYSND